MTAILCRSNCITARYNVKTTFGFCEDQSMDLGLEYRSSRNGIGGYRHAHAAPFFNTEAKPTRKAGSA